MEPDVADDWVKEHTLGTGGFGVVTLWVNKLTNQKLALKKCSRPNGPVFTKKHRERWEVEVSIMRKLNHPNVIRSMAVPPSLDVSPSDMPVLAMEYCTKGDLRKVLNSARNCCGLPEREVRNLIHDISSAIEYLHGLRIVHRDLKPENIVMQDEDGKTIYKLIDLGYAKEMDSSSLLNSFVGTLQYLAPELFMNTEYTTTVDFWSLGLVTHEVIVGFRPFLPNMSPVQWIEHVHKKKSEHICVYSTFDDKIEYSSILYKENHLSETLAKSFEPWLKVMLECDPSKRGIRKNEDDSKEVVAFPMLKEILSKQIVHAFCVPTGQLYSYEIDERTDQALLQQWIAESSGLDLANLEFLLNRGMAPDPKKPAIQCWKEPDNYDEWLLYVFSKNAMHPTIIPPRRLPKIVHLKVLHTSKELISHQNKKKLWAHVLFFLETEALLFKRLLQAHKVMLMHIMQSHNQMRKTSDRMVTEMNKLQAKSEFFQEILNTDRRNFKDFSLTSPSLEENLNHDNCVKKIDELNKTLIEKVIDADSISTRTVELQRSIYSMAKPREQLTDLYESAVRDYEEFRKNSKVKRDDLHLAEKASMSKYVDQCLSKRAMLLKAYFHHLEIVMKCKREILEMSQPFEESFELMKTYSAKLSSLQKMRQKILWKAIQSSVKSRKPEKHSMLSSGTILQSFMPNQILDHVSIAMPVTPDVAPNIWPMRVSSNESPALQPTAASQAFTSKASMASSFALSQSNSVGQIHQADAGSMTSFSSILDKLSEKNRSVLQENEEMRKNMQAQLMTMGSLQPSTKSSNA